ncbi:MAG: endonuclease [Candidatus Thermoplasmatota archaeon]|nr:endonuclease [Candidatus Thermoplasmatota archaeon]
MDLRDVIEALERGCGRDEWWPSESVFEVIVGAILAQRVSWKNVQIAIANLKCAQVLDPRAIMGLDESRLQELIRPSGFYRQKARYLRTFSAYLIDRYDGDIKLMKGIRTAQLRGELLSLDGIGPETADTILLYALGHPSFVVDSYAFRLFDRLGLGLGRSYDKVKTEVEDAIGRDVRRLSLAHALVVTHCKTHCLATPLCLGCPFSGICPSEVHDG